MPSPKITAEHWGELEVEELGTLKDAMLWPGGGRAWDWSERGTGHGEGIQPGDALELVEQGAEHIVLSQGREERLAVPEETIEALQERGVVVEVLPTGQAIARYNELAEAGRPVGALIHSTC
jgi:hypothetical protein